MFLQKNCNVIFLKWGGSKAVWNFSVNSSVLVGGGFPIGTPGFPWKRRGGGGSKAVWSFSANSSILGNPGNPGTPVFARMDEFPKLNQDQVTLINIYIFREEVKGGGP